MPVIGETKQRFTRSYVWLNPAVGSSNFTAGTWRLTTDDDSGGTDPDISALIETGIIAPGVTIAPSQLIYIDESSGQLRLAQANSTTTGKVAGISLTGGSPGDTIQYTRNQGVTIQDPASRIDGAPSELELSKYYYLSATTAGNLTRTPDTTTSGSVVVQVGLALSRTELTIEIQAPLLI